MTTLADSGRIVLVPHSARFCCPVCDQRGLERLIEHDIGVGQWAFLCLVCGAVVDWDCEARRWVLREGEGVS